MTHHRFAVQAPDSDLDAPTPSMEDAANRRSALVEHLGFTEAEATAFLNGDREILRSVAARRMHRQSGLTLVDNDLMG